MSTNQGMPRIAYDSEVRGKASEAPLRPPEGPSPNPWLLASRTVRKVISVVLATKFVAICYGRLRRCGKRGFLLYSLAPTLNVISALPPGPSSQPGVVSILGSPSPWLCIQSPTYLQLICFSLRISHRKADRAREQYYQLPRGPHTCFLRGGEPVDHGFLA